MRSTIFLLHVVLPVLYFITVWTYAKAFFRGIKFAESLKTPLLLTTLSIHALYIIILTLEFSHPPITTIFEIFSLIAFTMALVYAYIEWRTAIHTTGYFILIFPFFFQIVSSLFIKELTAVPEILHSNLLGFHVLSAFLGYTAITISAVYGFLYLMLYHDIKSSRFGVIYKRLPNLEILERLSFTSAAFGFVLLTITIIIGIIWLPQSLMEFSYTDPKLLVTFIIWIIYAVGLSAKKIARWQGRRIIVLSMFGFAIAMVSLTIVNMFFSEFHKFY